MEKFIKYLRNNNYSENTIRTYKSVMSQYINSLHDIRLIRKKLKDKLNNSNTCILHYNVLLSYLKWSKDNRINSLRSFKLPKNPIVYYEVFTKNYLYRKTEINEYDTQEIISKKMTIRFLFETGLRANELKSIIEVNKKTVKVKGKGSKVREIMHKNETTSRCLPFNKTTKTLRLWVKEILGDKYTPHSIRRSFATHMLSSGANPKMVMLQLGHEKIETTFRYMNLSINCNYKIYNKYI